jgi:HEPN domain-containing protein
MNPELVRRGALNIEDAAFVRDHFIPVAMKSKRWNIVMFEAFRTIELIIKGMVRLSGHEPRNSHEVKYVIDDFLKLLARKRKSLPFLYSAASPSGHAYGIYSDGTFLELLKKVHGTYTSLAAIRSETSIDQLLQLRLDVEKSTVSVYCGDELILRTTDSTISDATRFSRSFNSPSNPAQIETLKKAAEQLKKTRPVAFFSDKFFSEDDAKKALSLMDSALEASKAFVTRAPTFRP